MSMEQRISTLEEVSQRIIEALQGFREAMNRYYAASALRDEAMLQAAEALERLQASTGGLEESRREMAEALERQDEIIQALQAFVPLTQTEIVRLDSRIDSIEEA